MNNFVRKFIGISFVTPVILGAPVLLSLSLIFNWSSIIAAVAMAFIVFVNVVFVCAEVEGLLYEDDND